MSQVGLNEVLVGPWFFLRAGQRSARMRLSDTVLSSDADNPRNGPGGKIQP
jgi:hypothetical protein